MDPKTSIRGLSMGSSITLTFEDENHPCLFKSVENGKIKDLQFHSCLYFHSLMKRKPLFENQ